MRSGPSPEVRSDRDWYAVTGRFFRAVDARHRDAALDGSRTAGRYSRPDQPTLYLSASREGADAALLAHPSAAERVLLDFAVRADRIADLRDPAMLARLRAALGDPLADWQAIAAAGGEPASWRVRDRLVAAGANGLIDPSRRAPGLWHLVLFRWNEPGGPTVAAA